MNRSEYFEIISKCAEPFSIEEEDIQKTMMKISFDMNVDISFVEKIILDTIHSIIFFVFKKAEKASMPLKSYQKLAVRHMAMHRGMICAFDVGTGKTLTAVAACDCVLKIAKVFGQNIKVIVITPTSLQNNFKKEMLAYGTNPEDPVYTFYTVAKFGMLYKEGKIDCSDAFLIVDEAHALRTDYRHLFVDIFEQEPKENTRAEFGIKCAALGCKVLLLTATPVYNKTHDIVNLISMVNGVDPPYKMDPFMYIEAQRLPAMQERYGKRILFQEPEDKKLYPEREDIYIRIVMDPSYEEKYTTIEEILYNKYKKEGEDLVLFSEDEEVISKSFLISLRKSANVLSNVCLKCSAAMTIIRRGQKTIFYSFFLNSGVELMKGWLEEENIPYRSITGSVTAKKRVEYVNEFNSADSGINLLIITKAGGEGLDLKGVKNVIIFEKGWNVAGEEQVIGRAIRYKSHIHLPEEERKVFVYHLLLVKSDTYPFLEFLKYEEEKKKHLYYSKIMEIWKNPKEIIIGKKYLSRPFFEIMLAIDEIMLINMLIKHTQNTMLLNALKDIQITEESIGDAFLEK